MTFGERMEEVMRERGATMRGLAKDAGIDRAYLYKIKRGDVDFPGVPLAAKIARALGVTVDHLLVGVDGVDQIQPPRTVRGWKGVGDEPPDIRGLSDDVAEAVQLMKRETGESPNLEDEDSRVRFLGFLQRARRARQERERAAGDDRAGGEDGEPTAPRNGRLSPGSQSA